MGEQINTSLGGRYTLIREIGSGGMGTVFEALDTKTGRTVAAKILTAGSQFDLQALLRFQQEGAVLATLRHPNIVRVYGTFLEEETASIVMEFLDGKTLGQFLREQSLSLARCKVILDQVLSSLEYAHKQGIVHRDIKPENIMVQAGDAVKVADFGIARVLQQGSTLNTKTGTTVGTPLYMSPEQIEGQKADGRTDIYSLGIVIYQMLTGRPPFVGDDPITVAFKHVHRAPQPPRQLNAAVPPEWEALVLRALEKDPNARFQTAATMREAIATLPPAGSIEASALPPQARAAERIDITQVVESDIPAAPVIADAGRNEDNRAGWRGLWPALAGGGVAIIVLAAVLLVWQPWKTSSALALTIPPDTTWYMQLDLSTGINLNKKVGVYILDMTAPAADIATLHSKGIKVLCFFSGGVVEGWRHDAGQFPKSVRGKNAFGAPDSFWLDVRKSSVIQPLMKARLDECKHKGFDGVLYGDLVAYASPSGVPVNRQMQLAYDRWLFQAAHDQGLATGMKDISGDAQNLLPHYDYFVMTGCFQGDLCDQITSVTMAGKAVFELELTKPPCARAKALHFSTVYGNMQLDGAKWVMC